MVLNDFIYGWAEIVGSIFGVFALIVSLILGASIASYFTILIFGLCFGRFLFRFKRDFKAPAIVIILFFYAGYLLSSVSINKIFISAIFFFSIFAAYLAHDKGFLHSIEY